MELPYGIVLDLFDPLGRTGTPLFYKYLGAPLRFVLHYHIASKPHFDLRLQYHKDKAISIAFYEGQLSKGTFEGTQVSDHQVSMFHKEGAIPSGKGKGAMVISDIGFFKVEGSLWRKDCETAARLGVTNGHLSISLYGSRLQGKLILRRTGVDPYGHSIWAIKLGEDINVSEDDLKSSLFTELTPRDYHEAWFQREEYIDSYQFIKEKMRELERGLLERYYGKDYLADGQSIFNPEGVTLL